MLVYLNELKLRYDVKTYCGHDIVLNFYISDLNKTYQVILTKTNCIISEKDFFDYTTKIETKSEIIKKIINGDFNRYKELISNDTKIYGDLECALKLNEYFPLKKHFSKQVNVELNSLDPIVFFSWIPLILKQILFTHNKKCFKGTDSSSMRLTIKNQVIHKVTKEKSSLLFSLIPLPFRWAFSNPENKESSMMTLLIPWAMFWTLIVKFPLFWGLISILITLFTMIKFRNYTWTIYDKLTFCLVPLFSLCFMIFGLKVLFLIPLSLFVYGLIWILSCLRSVSIIGEYAKYDYGDNLALKDNDFLKVTQYISALWGIIFIFYCFLVMFAVETPIGSYIGIITLLFSFIMRCWISWYSRWKLERIKGKHDIGILEGEVSL